jgi:hypothetical protein
VGNVFEWTIARVDESPRRKASTKPNYTKTNRECLCTESRTRLRQRQTKVIEANKGSTKINNDQNSIIGSPIFSTRGMESLRSKTLLKTILKIL